MLSSTHGQSISWLRSTLTRLTDLLLLGLVSGLISGVLIGGIGSRLAMRLSGLLTTDGRRFIRTQANQRVGEITVDGTAFLILLGTVNGLIGAMFYVAIKRWFPKAWRWWQSGLAFGLLLLLVGGTQVIEGNNFDFHTFGPLAVNLTTFSALFFLFGLLLTFVVDRLERWGKLRTRRLFVQLPIVLLLTAAFVQLTVQQVICIIDQTGCFTDVSTTALLTFVLVASGVGILVTAVGDTDDGPLSIAKTRRWAYLASGLAALAGLFFNIQAFVQLISSPR